VELYLHSPNTPSWRGEGLHLYLQTLTGGPHDGPTYFSRHLRVDLCKSSLPVPVAAQRKSRTVFGRSNTVTAGSNPARGMDVFAFFSVLCCPA
jgi:hypothetical protein